MTGYDLLYANAYPSAKRMLDSNNVQPILIDGMIEQAIKLDKKNPRDFKDAPDFHLPMDWTVLCMKANRFKKYLNKPFSDIVVIITEVDWKAMLENFRSTDRYFRDDLVIDSRMVNKLSNSGQVLSFEDLDFQITHAKKVIASREYVDAVQASPYETSLSMMYYGVNKNMLIPLAANTITFEINRSLSKIFTVWNAKAVSTERGVNGFDSSHELRQSTHAVLLLLNIINSRGVTVAERDAFIPNKKERRQKIVGHRFKTIVIGGRDTYTRYPGKTEAENHNAEHFCMGNYAYYTKDKPLFGNPKLTGRIWRSPHMRGKNKEARIDHTYVADSENLGEERT